VSTLEDASGRVADALDAGQIPWRFRSGLPMNVANRKFYGGVNPILLEIAAGTLGVSSPWWGTLREWQTVGSTVQPDSLGARIPHCPEAVHHLEQTDHNYEPPPLALDDPAPVFDAIIRNGGVNIEYVFSAECKYIGAEDKIRMPHKWLFEIGAGGISGYWDAKAHELCHFFERRTGWAAHPDVCELRAEIGSGYLLGALGIKPLPLHLARHHRKFAPRWSRLLRQEPGLLFKVCDHVVATLDYLFRLARRGSLANFAPVNPVLPDGGGE
jgi:antirestriction protein ArdC